MIEQQNSELATLSSIQGPNYTAPNILSVYQNSGFGLKVKDNMTKDPAQYNVRLQNELAKEIANSKYSGKKPSSSQEYIDRIVTDLQNNFLSAAFMNSIDEFGDKGWIKVLEKAPTVVGGVLNTLFKLSDSLGNFVNIATNGLISPNILDGISNSSSGVIRSLSEGIETFAKSGPEIGRAMAFIGPAIDFTSQVSAGENVPNAVIKTGIHTIVSGAAVKGGMAIGTAIMPGVGTVIGFLGGVAVGIIANSAIDMIYDNTVGEFVTETTDNMMKAGKEVIDGVGNAVSDFFSGIGTVFQ